MLVKETGNKIKYAKWTKLVGGKHKKKERLQGIKPKS